MSFAHGPLRPEFRFSNGLLKVMSVPLPLATPMDNNERDATTHHSPDCEKSVKGSYSGVRYWSAGAGDRHEQTYGTRGTPQDDGGDASYFWWLRQTQHGQLQRLHTGSLTHGHLL